MSKPRHIICDLSDVLILGLGGSDGPLAKGLNLNHEALFAAFSGPVLISFLKGHCLEEQFLTSAIHTNGWQISPAALSKLIKANFEIPFPDTIALMRRLGESYPLTLLSDHTREWTEFILEAHPFIEDLFPTRIFSFETGTIKSERQTFLHTLDVIGAKPQECLFIDDILINVQCARSVGIPCIQYLDAGQLAIDLANLGLLTPQKLRTVSPGRNIPR